MTKPASTALHPVATDSLVKPRHTQDGWSGSPGLHNAAVIPHCCRTCPALAALIALVIINGITTAGTKISSTFTSISNSLK
ncbi:MAG TPA: hypothetical protein VH189_15915 [Rhizomicrobium sp.]|nr:hypothetical protein [Rhizomicrobium sp.]